MNGVYESSRPEVIDKPLPSSSRGQKDEYIRLKYVQRAFLNKDLLREAGEHEERHLEMHRRASDNNLEGLMHMLAMGADVTWSNVLDANKTCLHKAAEAGALACVEFLYQNNASLDVRDDLGFTPLDLALDQNPGGKVALRLQSKRQERLGT
jgi:hypothetical protein